MKGSSLKCKTNTCSPLLWNIPIEVFKNVSYTFKCYSKDNVFKFTVEICWSKLINIYIFLKCNVFIKNKLGKTILKVVMCWNSFEDTLLQYIIFIYQNRLNLNKNGFGVICRLAVCCKPAATSWSTLREVGGFKRIDQWAAFLGFK